MRRFRQGLFGGIGNDWGIHGETSLPPCVVSLTCVVLYYISYFHFSDDIHGQVSFWFLLVSGGSQRTTICPHSDKHAKSSGTVKDRPKLWHGSYSWLEALTRLCRCASGSPPVGDHRARYSRRDVSIWDDHFGATTRFIGWLATNPIEPYLQCSCRMRWRVRGSNGR